MAARVLTHCGPAGDEPALLTRLAGDGWSGGYGWGNGPHEEYPEHSHAYDKALFCVRGSIVFSTADGDLPPGSRRPVGAGARYRALRPCRPAGRPVRGGPPLAPVIQGRMATPRCG